MHTTSTASVDPIDFPQTRVSLVRQGGRVLHCHVPPQSLLALVHRRRLFRAGVGFSTPRPSQVSVGFQCQLRKTPNSSHPPRASQDPVSPSKGKQLLTPKQPDEKFPSRPRAGMDEMEFTEAESNMNDLVSEYQQYQAAAMSRALKLKWA